MTRDYYDLRGKNIGIAGVPLEKMIFVIMGL
jgi:hypothetical protein